jgi:hypothetical protein
MAKYVKLGGSAESFYDPYSEFSLAGKEVKVLEAKALTSNRVKAALSGGHLSHASEKEFLDAGGVIESGDDTPEVETFESEFGNNAEELLAYYKENYEVTKADITAFKKLSLEDKVKELTKLAAE